MLILGLSGGFLFPYENQFNLPDRMFHDSAAVLLKDGEVLAAIEEERINRIKHTNKAPIQAMRYCLQQSGYDFDAIDKIAVCFNETTYNYAIKTGYLLNPDLKDFKLVREYLQRAVKEAFGKEIDEAKIQFVPHHQAHAESTYAMSGFENGLVVIFDGQGDDDYSGLIVSWQDGKPTVLKKLPFELSLGIFYVDVIMYLGYTQFDEYKVMGLAPYGDPAKYRRIFKRLYSLLPNGEYVIHFHYLSLLHDIAPPRRKHEPFTQVHKDIAAALQETLETIVIHVLKHYKEQTGHTRLCMAGGVAHNCSLIGKLEYAQLFEKIFVQPASHDAGAALGAALYLSRKAGDSLQMKRLAHVYWGLDINEREIRDTLSDWDEFVAYRRVDDVIVETAELLANGAVVGWVQGRSEFGPRALGNRSIIADPRPALNKDRINYMVKKREGYRPFAPSVPEEIVADYFEIPGSRADYRFMNVILNVKPDKQESLGAVTHVDGTARVQTVSRDTNTKYWELIHAFGKRTGTYVLLNTSFNNHAEPIVDSPNDAVTCFLTTQIDYLVIGDYVVFKKNVGMEQQLKLIPQLPVHVILKHEKKYINESEMSSIYTIEVNYSSKNKKVISRQMFEALQMTDGCTPWGDLLRQMGEKEHADVWTEELMELWSSRLLILRPKSNISNMNSNEMMNIGGHYVK